MQPVRRSSSERSTIQYVDEDAPTPRRIARGSLAAGRATAAAKRVLKEGSTVRVSMDSIQPLLERAKSSTTDIHSLYDRSEETTRPLDYDGVTLPRDRAELSATDVAPKPPRARTTTTGKHVIPRPRHTVPQGISIPTAVGPFATVGPETTVTNELAYDLLALIQPPRARRVEEPIAYPVVPGEPSEVIELVDRVPRAAIYPIEPVKMAPLVTAKVSVPVSGGTLREQRKRRRWIVSVVLLIVIAGVAFSATYVATKLGLLSTKTAHLATPAAAVVEERPVLHHEARFMASIMLAHEPSAIVSVMPAPIVDPSVASPCQHEPQNVVSPMPAPGKPMTVRPKPARRVVVPPAGPVAPPVAEVEAAPEPAPEEPVTIFSKRE